MRKDTLENRADCFGASLGRARGVHLACVPAKLGHKRVNITTGRAVHHVWFHLGSLLCRARDTTHVQSKPCGAVRAQGAQVGNISARKFGAAHGAAKCLIWTPSEGVLPSSSTNDRGSALFRVVSSRADSSSSRSRSSASCACFRVMREASDRPPMSPYRVGLPADASPPRGGDALPPLS
eukprot:7378774-Prymnesium_polylepis.3